MPFAPPVVSMSRFWTALGDAPVGASSGGRAPTGRHELGPSRLLERMGAYRLFARTASPSCPAAVLVVFCDRYERSKPPLPRTGRGGLARSLRRSPSAVRQRVITEMQRELTATLTVHDGWAPVRVAHKAWLVPTFGQRAKAWSRLDPSRPGTQPCNPLRSNCPRSAQPDLARHRDVNQQRPACTTETPNTACGPAYLTTTRLPVPRVCTHYSVGSGWCMVFVTLPERSFATGKVRANSPSSGSNSLMSEGESHQQSEEKNAIRPVHARTVR